MNKARYSDIVVKLATVPQAMERYKLGRNSIMELAENNEAIDPAEIGIESTFDTKMMVLDNLTEHLNNVIKYYGENNPLVPEEEKLKVNYVYFSDNVIQPTETIKLF